MKLRFPLVVLLFPLFSSLAATPSASSEEAPPYLEIPTWLQRAGLRFVAEVPYNNIAANTVPGCKSILRSLQHILTHKGYAGFYSGGTLEMVRSGIWWPRMWLLDNAPHAIQTYHPLLDSHSVVNTLTAASVTSLEGVFMPLFRWRNAQMLASTKMTQAQINHLFKTLYAGTLLKSAATFPSWLAFLYSNDVASHYFPDSKAAQMGLTSATQLLAAIATAPLYVVILLRQHPSDPCNKPFWQSLSHQYRLYGMPLFQRTATIGAGHLILQGILTNLIQK